MIYVGKDKYLTFCDRCGTEVLSSTYDASKAVREQHVCAAQRNEPQPTFTERMLGITERLLRNKRDR